MNDTANIVIPVSAEPESGAAVRCTDLLDDDELSQDSEPDFTLDELEWIETYE